MRIVTLIENTTDRSTLACEHGLSLYIEANGKKILFDAGQSGAFADNAAKLGIDLGRVDFAVLSHGHYDHGGGLKRFLAVNDAAQVYVSSRAFGDYHNASGRYIGLDKELRDNPRVIRTDGDLEIARGISLRVCGGAYPIDSAGLTKMENGVRVPDDFRHEHYLLIEEAGKRALISGCSHRGILNIAGWFRPDVLVGGFHFMKLDPGDGALIRAARQLLEYPAVYYTGHCTGEAQYAVMKKLMGSRLHSLTTGIEIIL